MYTLGFDSGGTKTAFLLSDSDGRILSSVTLPTDASWAGYAQMLRAGSEQLFRAAGQGSLAQVSAVCGGVLCYGEDAAWEAHCHRTVAALYPQATTFLANDVVVGMYGSLGMRSGIHIVAGTGAIGYGRNERNAREGRTGGWADFSDEGSCAWLGSQTLEHFCKELDGRLPRGPLYNIVVRALQLQEPIALNLLEVYRARYAGRREALGSLQMLLLEAYHAGDAAAAALYDAAAAHLAMLVRGLYRQLQMQGDVDMSYSGGLFKTGEVILRPLRKHLSDLPLRMQPPLLQPVQGALLKALTLQGMPREVALQTMLAQRNCAALAADTEGGN